MFKDKFQFSREQLEFAYSVIVLLAIPLLVVANTLLLAVSVRNNFDAELRRKANLANSVVAAAATPNLSNANLLQSEVTAIVKSSDELSSVAIIQPQADGTFKTLASSGSESIANAGILYSLTATRQQAIAQQATTKDGTRLWEVVSPIVQLGSTRALVATAVSSQLADSLVGNTLLQSIAVVGVTVVIVVLLLFNHFRFVEYAMLFRKLKELDQMKNDFLSVATHELRAPMTVIKGSIENLMDGITGQVDEKGKQSLQTMFNETERLNNLVTDLLNVSRLEQGRITYNMVTFDSRDVIGQIVNQYMQKAHDKGLALEYQKPEQPVNIHVDKGRFIEIMTNLVDNAIKYSRTGTVTVSHKPATGKTRISVRDTGIGMSASARERLFSRFYRIQNDNTKDIPGTGLGLWIIKQYIEHMGGTISVDSLEGVGSEFIVEFPLATDQHPPAA